MEYVVRQTYCISTVSGHHIETEINYADNHENYRSMKVTSKGPDATGAVKTLSPTLAVDEHVCSKSLTLCQTCFASSGLAQDC